MEKEGKKVVIIGGGIAGSLVAKNLQSHAHVTLIDPKEYFEITWASLRSMVQPSFAERSLINHRDYLTHGDIVTSYAVNITETEVWTAEGRRINYDYLIIATGHADHVPKSRPERLDQFKEENEKIKSADSILIVGGGPTGVELAGEIAIDFPDKKITLVHKGPRLLDFVGTNAADKTLKWLESKNVVVKLEQSVDLNAFRDGLKIYQTSNGENIVADCHFLCLGKPLGSTWLNETVLKNDLDFLGRIKVDEQLRVKGWSNIFAIGDITDVPEIKQGFAAQQHAEVVARNLKVMIEGGKKQCNRCGTETYKPQLEMAIVSLGRKEAVAQFPFLTIIGRFPGYIKSGDLFVGRTRKQMGLNPNI
ncbi:apoptosis-inducing factor homolog A [Cajanus cajan]|uniref:Apoptosis-inducing factor isogeny A n=1 Tax=Cajanus cajan TaxID=3821 RepID=A0A151TNN8_CAJCA|nr:apoptosis-inducing factor homolog A [Cajanus cajan]KYP68675.1 Apoptosis-inducing factor isogeny A [Cajanus cajan]